MSRTATGVGPPPGTVGRMAAMIDEDGTVRVTGHAEVLRVVRDPQTFSSDVSRFLQVPNNLDGEEHAAFRAVLDPYFAPDRMATLAGPCRRIAARLVAELPRGSAVDAVSGLGVRYAVEAMLAWLGWPAELEEDLVRWVADNAEATRSGELARTAEVAQRFDEIIGRVVEPRLADPATQPRDVTDELLRDTVDGRHLSREEVVSVLRNWTGGDLGSLALCVGVILHQLAADPAIEADVRARRGDPARLDAAIDELLRRDDPFLSNRRVATADTVVGGCPVTAGSRLTVEWTDANRDPAVFPDPDRYAPEAHAHANLVYGAGPHVCPGRPLATLELRILLEEVLDRTTDLALDPESRGERAVRPLGGWASAPVILT